jgi:hypothetical protein
VIDEAPGSALGTSTWWYSLDHGRFRARLLSHGCLTGVFKRRMIRAVQTGNPRCAGGRAGPHNGHSVNGAKTLLIVPIVSDCGARP